MLRLASISSIGPWLALSLGCAIAGCNASASTASPSEVDSAATSDAVSTPAPASSAPTSIKAQSSASPAVDDKPLRRSYGAADMKVAACAKLEKDGTIVGTNCPSNVVVFGPYVGAPANSNVWVSFDVQSDGPISVTSDAISEVGKRFHGVMNEQSVAKGEKRNLGFGVHLSEATTALEARISVRSEAPVKFTIRNLSVRVQ